MKYFQVFLFAGIIFGIESRALSPSSFDEALRRLQWILTVNQASQIEEILPATEALNSFLGSTIKHSDNDVNHLRFMLEDYLEKKIFNVSQSPDSVDDSPESRTTTSSQIYENINSLKDLVTSVEELDIYYQDGPDDGRHVKSRYEDSSAMFPLVKKRNHGVTSFTEESGNNGKEETEAKELDSMLLDLQNQINRMRKYSKRLCRKHRSTSFSTTEAFDGDPELLSPLVLSTSKGSIINAVNRGSEKVLN